MNNSLLGKFFKYLRNPTYYIENSKQNTLKTIWQIIRLLAFLYVIIIFVGILDYILLAITHYDISNHAVNNLVDNEPVLLTLLLSCVIAPFSEEATFRLILRFSYKKLALAITCIIILLFDLLKDFILTNIPSWILSVRTVLGGFSYIVFLIIAFLIIFFLCKKLIQRDKAEQFYIKHIRKLFYLSAILFASIHIANYLNIGSLIFITPILVLPQFFAGIFLGYIRMNFGFKWGIFTHGLFNFIALSSFLLLKVFGLSPADLSNLKNLSEFQIASLASIGLIVILFLLIFIALNIYNFIEYYLQRKNNKISI